MVLLKKITKPIPGAFLSYGQIKGIFDESPKNIKKISLDSNYSPNGAYTPQQGYNSSYAFAEYKTHYYRLMFDFDYKGNDPIIEPYLNQHQEITNYLIQKIIISLSWIITNPDIKYIYAIKNQGYGVHLYWPNIVLDKELHMQIYDLAIMLIEKDNQYPLDIIKKIFDKSVCKSNGLRLFYNQINGSYYYPVSELSTFEFSPDKKKHFKYCLINTSYSHYNFELEPDYVEALRLEKELKSEKDFDNWTDKYIESDLNIQLFMELINLLDSNRWDNYVEWMELVFLFRTYELKDELIELSKQSKKFDAQSIQTINKIFNKPIVVSRKKTIGSLIFWAKQDNYQ